MDLKRIFTSMLLAGGLMLVFLYFTRGFGGGAAAAPKLFPYEPYSRLADFKSPDESRAGEAGVTPDLRVLGNIAAGKDRDKLEITVSNVTAGINRVRFAEYYQTTAKKDPLTLFQAVAGTPKPFATIGVHARFKGEAKEIPYGLVTVIEGAKTTTRQARPDDDAETIAKANATCLLDSQYAWKIESSDTHKVVLSLTLAIDGKPLVKIFKSFELLGDSYDIAVVHTIENLSGKELEVAIDQLGGIELFRDDPQMDDRYFMAMRLNSAKGYLDTGSPINITHTMMPKGLAGIKNEYTGNVDPMGTKTLPQMNDMSKDPTLWVASANRFFATIVRPEQESAFKDTLKLQGAKNTPDIRPAHHVQNAAIDLVSVNEKQPEKDLAILRLQGAMVTIPAGADAAPGRVVEPISVYLGPKKQNTLEGYLDNGTAAPAGSPLAAHGIFQYIGIVQFNTCWLYSFCVNGTLVYSLLWLLDVFAKYVAFGNYGIAIMILVIVVRAVLHPLTRASQINMAKMGKQMREIQPKLEAIKKRYADNREKQTQEQMKLYREHNINPAGGVLGCLPMMLQLPIWAALMAGLRLDIDLRHASFIPGWINDLSNPDTVFPIGAVNLATPLFTLPIVGFPIYGLNPLPILLGVVLFFNMKVTMATQPKPADESQAQAQKWSSYSIFMLPFFLYNASSGSNLYFFASTIGGLVDTYFIRKSLKRQGILPPSAKDLPTSEENK